MSYYHHYTTAHLVDTSQYSFSTPTHHDDTAYHVNTLSYEDSIYSEPDYPNSTTSWSSPLPSSIKQACELEAYAETMANRVYSWDEIHPAYREHPMDN